MSIPSLPARLRSLLRKRSRSRWPARLRFYVPAFLLALLLVGAQQAALLHAFEHDVARAAGSVAAAQAAAQTASPSSDTREHEQGAPGGSYCDKCFQFAHLTGAGFAAASAVLDLTASTEAARSRGAPERAVRAPASRSRGPPIAL
jgi:hypothetical protein